MTKRKPSLATKYRALRRDARIMAELLDIASLRLEQVGRRHLDSTTVLAKSIDGEHTYTASDIRKLASECTSVAYERGRGRGRKQS